MINKKPLFKPSWPKNGIVHVNDLLDINGSFLSYDNLINCYDIHTNFLEYHGIINSIQSTWGQELNHISKETIEENNNIVRLKSKIKPSKCFYPIFISKISEEPRRVKDKWAFEIDLTIDLNRWKEVFKLPYKITYDTKLQSFQYKVLHRILPTNSLLMKCNITATELCTFCHETKESILHLFCNCSHSITIWRNIESELKIKCNLDIRFDKENIILGTFGQQCNALINHLILLVKRFLYICKCREELPTFTKCIFFLQEQKKIDQYSFHLYTNKKLKQIKKIWQVLNFI